MQLWLKLQVEGEKVVCAGLCNFCLYDRLKLKKEADKRKIWKGDTGINMHRLEGWKSNCN